MRIVGVGCGFDQFPMLRSGWAMTAGLLSGGRGFSRAYVTRMMRGEYTSSRSVPGFIRSITPVEFLCAAKTATVATAEFDRQPSARNRESSRERVLHWDRFFVFLVACQ